MECWHTKRNTEVCLHVFSASESRALKSMNYHYLPLLLSVRRVFFLWEGCLSQSRRTRRTELCTAQQNPFQITAHTQIFPKIKSDSKGQSILQTLEYNHLYQGIIKGSTTCFIDLIFRALFDNHPFILSFLTRSLWHNLTLDNGAQKVKITSQRLREIRVIGKFKLEHLSYQL